MHAGQHYDGEAGHGEIDCLVSGAVPVVVEVKSQSLTDAGRRGQRRRISRVADDVVAKSFDQTKRAAEYIESGGRAFSDREGGGEVERLPEVVESALRVVVTFERMDPLALAAAELIDADDEPVWVTNLADLLMVADVLADPAGFLTYVEARGKAVAAGLQIYMESDALGGYLIDRLETIVAKAVSVRDDNTRVTLSYCSTAINEYFTLSEMRGDAPNPGTGVPAPIRDALSGCADGFSAAWWALAGGDGHAHRPLAFVAQVRAPPQG